MSDYERTLAIDRSSRELGLSKSEILSQLDEFQNGQVKPSNSPPPNHSQPTRESNFHGKKSRKKALLDSWKILTSIDSHMTRVTRERRGSLK